MEGLGRGKLSESLGSPKVESGIMTAQGTSESFMHHPASVRFWLSAQPVDATHALNLSAGVSKLNVLRGRSFN